MGDLKKIRIVYTCPECGSRYWLVIQNGQDEPYCECSDCGLIGVDSEEDMVRI